MQQLEKYMIRRRADRSFVYLLGVILISVVLPSFIIYFSLSLFVVAGNVRGQEFVASAAVD